VLLVAGALIVAGALLHPARAAQVPPAAEDAPGVLIRGRLQNGEGEPLAGVQVTLIRTHKRVDLGRLQWKETEGVLDRSLTDAQGFYEIRAADDGSFSSYFLRFHDPQTFDAVRYVPPPDEDITRRFRRGRPLVENRVAREQRDWPKVQEEIARVGADSVRGRLLRRLGLPERVERPEPARPEREEWWYYRRGIVYQFDGSEAAGERRFDPVPAPPPVAAAES
jgi:hypothetical protein